MPESNAKIMRHSIVYTSPRKMRPIAIKDELRKKERVYMPTRFAGYT